jgi:BirA family biotin operon repressor/biotin-[acetyl-CoA-carboxylase] ligase
VDEQKVPALDARAIGERLADREVHWPPPTVLASTGSTNADALERARSGAPEGTVIVADEQTAGRGRLGRSWVSAPGEGLWFSVLIRMDPGPARGLLPLLAGVAVAESVRRRGVDAGLKWPNDVVVEGLAHDGSPGPRKLAGILAETDGGDGVVLGVGVNVSQGPEGLPTPQATSLALEGVAAGRQDLLVDILIGLHSAVENLRREGAGLAIDPYRALCLTIGREVTVALPAGDTISGRAVGVGEDGQLHVRTSDRTVSLAAGDVIHATI